MATASAKKFKRAVWLIANYVKAGETILTECKHNYENFSLQKKNAHAYAYKYTKIFIITTFYFK